MDRNKCGFFVPTLVITASIALYVTATKPDQIGAKDEVLRTAINAAPAKAQATPQVKADNPENRESAAEYRLRTRGYLSEVPLSQAVDECNHRIQATTVGKTQPALTDEEVVAAIRDWKHDEAHISPQMYKLFQSIAQTGTMPKGSYFFFTTGTVSYNGYDIDALHIYLRVGLDKYPEDVKGVPVYERQIRMQYISSRPTRFP